MKKKEIIGKYGEKAYGEILEQNKERGKIWRINNPDKVKVNNAKYGPENNRKNHPEECRKGGRYYEKHLKDNRTGLRGKRNVIRHKHGNFYRPFKQIIAPESQLHHEWILETADYRGVALVETDQHLHGFIDVIQIMEGEITLLTEAEIRGAIERNG